MEEWTGIRPTTAIGYPLLHMADVGLERNCCSWRSRIRTHRSKVHEEGEGDDPEVPGVEHVATIELEEEQASRSDIRTRDHRAGRRTNQKTISRPIVQTKCSSGNNTDRIVSNAVLVYIRAAGEVAVIHVGSEKYVGICPHVHGR